MASSIRVDFNRREKCSDTITSSAAITEETVEQSHEAQDGDDRDNNEENDASGRNCVAIDNSISNSVGNNVCDSNGGIYSAGAVGKDSAAIDQKLSAVTPRNTVTTNKQDNSRDDSRDTKKSTVKNYTNIEFNDKIISRMAALPVSHKTIPVKQKDGAKKGPVHKPSVKTIYQNNQSSLGYPKFYGDEHSCDTGDTISLELQSKPVQLSPRDPPSSSHGPTSNSKAVITLREKVKEKKEQVQEPAQEDPVTLQLETTQLLVRQNQRGLAGNSTSESHSYITSNNYGSGSNNKLGSTSDFNNIKSSNNSISSPYFNDSIASGIENTRRSYLETTQSKQQTVPEEHISRASSPNPLSFENSFVNTGMLDAYTRVVGVVQQTDALPPFVKVSNPDMADTDPNDSNLDYYYHKENVNDGCIVRGEVVSSSGRAFVVQREPLNSSRAAGNQWGGGAMSHALKTQYEAINRRIKTLNVMGGGFRTDASNKSRPSSGVPEVDGSRPQSARIISSNDFRKTRVELERDAMAMRNEDQDNQLLMWTAIQKELKDLKNKAQFSKFVLTNNSQNVNIGGIENASTVNDAERKSLEPTAEEMMKYYKHKVVDAKRQTTAPITILAVDQLNNCNEPTFNMSKKGKARVQFAVSPKSMRTTIAQNCNTNNLEGSESRKSSEDQDKFLAEDMIQSIKHQVKRYQEIKEWKKKGIDELLKSAGDTKKSRTVFLNFPTVPQLIEEELEKANAVTCHIDNSIETDQTCNPIARAYQEYGDAFDALNSAQFSGGINNYSGGNNNNHIVADDVGNVKWRSFLAYDHDATRDAVMKSRRSYDECVDDFSLDNSKNVDILLADLELEEQVRQDTLNREKFIPSPIDVTPWLPKQNANKKQTRTYHSKNTELELHGTHLGNDVKADDNSSVTNYNLWGESMQDAFELYRDMKVAMETEDSEIIDKTKHHTESTMYDNDKSIKYISRTSIIDDVPRPRSELVVKIPALNVRTVSFDGIVMTPLHMNTGREAMSRMGSESARTPIAQKYKLMDSTRRELLTQRENIGIEPEENEGDKLPNNYPFKTNYLIEKYADNAKSQEASHSDQQHVNSLENQGAPHNKHGDLVKEFDQVQQYPNGIDFINIDSYDDNNAWRANKLTPTNRQGSVALRNILGSMSTINSPNITPAATPKTVHKVLDNQLTISKLVEEQKILRDKPIQLIDQDRITVPVRSGVAAGRLPSEFGNIDTVNTPSHMYPNLPGSPTSTRIVNGVVITSGHPWSYVYPKTIHKPKENPLVKLDSGQSMQRQRPKSASIPHTTSQLLESATPTTIAIEGTDNLFGVECKPVAICHRATSANGKSRPSSGKRLTREVNAAMKTFDAPTLPKLYIPEKYNNSKPLRPSSASIASNCNSNIKNNNKLVGPKVCSDTRPHSANPINRPGRMLLPKKDQ